MVEICANRPGEIWVEIIGAPAMVRHELPALTVGALRHIAERVAVIPGNRSTKSTAPLGRPSIRRAVSGGTAAGDNEGGAFAIRKQVIKEMRLEDYRRMGSFDRFKPSGAGELTDLDCELCKLLEANQIEAFIRLAAQSRISMLVSGGTSSGNNIPQCRPKGSPIEERILSIEDARELKPHQPNYLPLVASRVIRARPGHRR